jgi:hypothetical protein
MSEPASPNWRRTNRPAYDDALRRCGSLLIWFDPTLEGLAARPRRLASHKEGCGHRVHALQPSSSTEAGLGRARLGRRTLDSLRAENEPCRRRTGSGRSLKART